MSAAVTLVTGASRGIGLEFVRQLLRRGDKVVATCRNPDKAVPLKELVASYSEDQVAVVPLDTSDESSISALAGHLSKVSFVQEHGLDVLINNAGISSSQHPSETWRDVMASDMMDVYRTNVVGPLLVTRALFDLLGRGTQKKVLNVSSIMGSIEKSGATVPSYRASKAALNMVCKCIAEDTREAGLIVLAVHPGWVDTDMGSSGGRKPPVKPEDSVAGMLLVCDGAGAAQSGTFCDYRGEVLPW
eukprot:m.291299 g.291299  ORF g.291299 m.291299 type:complete len:245 (+) comp12452_c0_seq1:40-774(+)